MLRRAAGCRAFLAAALIMAEAVADREVALPLTAHAHALRKALVLLLLIGGGMAIYGLHLACSA